MEITDDNFLDILLPYQLPHLKNMSKAYDENQVILDASDTGTGKTYSTCALIKLKASKPLIVCPKSVIPSWIKVCKIFNIDILGIANYEALKSQKMYDINMNYISCPYILKIIDQDLIDELNEEDSEPSSNKSKGKNNKNKKKVNVNDVEDNDDEKKGKEKEKSQDIYKFIIPDELKDNMVIIFDEAHRCKNAKTTNSKILIACYQSGVKMILLSATISDKIECFKPFGNIFGFYDKLNTYNIWMRRQLMVFKVVHDKTEYSEDQKKIDIIHKRVFPKKGSRMKISLLGNLFPQNHIISQSYYLADHDEINRLYQEMNQAIAELRIKELRTFALGKIIRCRQRIEVLKVPIFLELAEEALENNYNVAIFVNYHETLEHIAFQLDADCFIHGKQGLEERNQCIDDFQNNKKKVIIAIIQAGGVGVSLHDLHGVQRMSIISPTWSGQDLVQCLGRIHRAGAKTPAIQKLVFCANTYEDRIAEIIKHKISNITGINDHDLVGPEFEQEHIELIDDEIKKMNIKNDFPDKSEEKQVDKKIKKVKKRTVKNVEDDNTDVVEL
jgi:superfamily II DNA or RNA helicase